MPATKRRKFEGCKWNRVSESHTNKREKQLNITQHNITDRNERLASSFLNLESCETNSCLASSFAQIICIISLSKQNEQIKLGPLAVSLSKLADILVVFSGASQ